ncbi:hypothetical protein N1027_06300 [Herbiconiux sp. CPCC 205763]|uniref:YCII-related domain-containing protein n=1 Tax=Herbiconiux aconitum TaxID=2970913 RepID=A0ABT2GNE8_9MICO|nr:hypothetical protein [Herbiconiux aconitum]MCS5717744.1 hypothetical protein [Herbiconiux aconitum]
MNGPTYVILTQLPGPSWVEGTDYNDQPDFWTHVHYMEEIFATGNVVLSGPFMHAIGGRVADGGMTVLKNVTVEEAQAIASADPTDGGMINTSVQPWWIPFHE